MLFFFLKISIFFLRILNLLLFLFRVLPAFLDDYSHPHFDTPLSLNDLNLILCMNVGTNQIQIDCRPLKINQIRPLMQIQCLVFAVQLGFLALPIVMDSLMLLFLLPYHLF